MCIAIGPTEDLGDSELPRFLMSQANPQWRARQMYRYMNAQWVELLQRTGSMRVSPITSYRDIGGVRQDTSEGRATTTVAGSGSLSGEQAKRLLGLDVRSITFEPGWKGQMTHNLDLPHGFMISASATFGRHLMKRFQADSFFTIISIDRFERAVARALSAFVKLEIVISDKVTYVDSKERVASVQDLVAGEAPPLGGRAEDFFRKPKRYAVESEFRFVFLTDEAVTSAVDIQLTDAECAGCIRFPSDYNPA